MKVAHYLWPEKDAAIEQIDIRTLPSGRLEACIYAAPGLHRGDLEEVPKQLQIVGYNTAFDQEDERHFLRVTGFDNADDLLQVLQRNAHIPAPQQVSHSGEDDKRGVKDWMADRAANLSGISGCLGHLALAIGGIIGDTKINPAARMEVLSAALYGGATSIYAVKGNGTPGGEIEEMMKGIEKYLKESGVSLPEDRPVTAEELSRKDGYIPKIQEYFNKYPLQIGNGIGVLGNLLLAGTGLITKKGGLEEVSQQEIETKRNIFKPLSGLASAMGGTIAAIVPEKPKEEKGQAEKSGGILDKLQSNPMKIAGVLQMTSNVMMLGNIAETHRKYAGHSKQQIMTTLAATTAATWLLAGFFASRSSKKPKTDYSPEEAANNISALSATMLAHMPEEQRGYAISKIAEKVAAQPTMEVKQEDIAKLITEKVNAIIDSPWLSRLNGQRIAQSVQGAQDRAPQHL